VDIAAEDALLQPTPLASSPLAERLRIGAGRRALAIGLMLLIEGLLLLMLLSFGVGKQPGSEKKAPIVLDFAPEARPEASPDESRTPDEQAEEQPSPPRQPTEEMPHRDEPLPAAPSQPPPPQPAQPAPPSPLPAPPAQRATEPASNPPRPVTPGKPVYGPPDTGRPAYLRDTERVGTAPNGEPLYAAAWYEEPRREALGAYLSAARGPGWGLIACRTVTGYRVEDCVGIAEYPEGSQIMRAVLAAAWEFKVRPPRRGGQPMVGSWVRIRIDYGIDRR
jgi:protein TonB